MTAELVPLLSTTVYYAIAGLAVGLFVSLYVLLLLLTKRVRPPTASELTFKTPWSNESQPLPSLFRDEPSVDLSVIVPAYNETQRLPIMLEETIDYLRKRRREARAKKADFSWEILVYDDCSTDETAQCALDWGRTAGKDCEIKVVRMTKNRGKGGVIQQAMLRGGGRQLLMVDADGATKFSDLTLLESKLRSILTGTALGVAIGSRAHLTKTDAVVKRSFIRNFLMYSFHSVLVILGIRGIGDTQCGFKLFSRAAAKLVFPNQHVQGWIFDIEVLLLARKFGIPLVEVPVTWREIDGSKMSLAVDSIKMLKDLVIIRGNYMLGLWKAHVWVDDPYAELLAIVDSKKKK